MSARTKPRPARKVPGPECASAEARRAAGVILEVLGGGTTPSDAAQVLGISTPRYFVLESRALGGMVSACEPRPRGYTRSAERQLASLRKEHARLERECSRYRALARAAQRTCGVVLPKKKEKGDKGKRKRTVRALVVARALKSRPGNEGGELESPEPGGGKETTP